VGLSFDSDIFAVSVHEWRYTFDRSDRGRLLGCGLRRSEAVHLTLNHFQRRDDHWAIVDLFGRGGHTRSVPVPNWVKSAIDRWTAAAQLDAGRLFRCVTKYGAVWGTGITERVVWQNSLKSPIIPPEKNGSP
jgi:integrase